MGFKPPDFVFFFNILRLIVFFLRSLPFGPFDVFVLPLPTIPGEATLRLESAISFLLPSDEIIVL